MVGWVRSTFRGVAVLLLLCGASSCDVASMPGAEPRVWRFALEEPLGSVQHEYALKFKELIEAKSEGRIQVKIYPYGALGTSDQITEQLQLGAIQFAMASPGHVGKIIPEVQVFLLHFVLSEDARVNQAVLKNPAILNSLDALYAKKGMQLLSIYTEGWQVWTTQEPIRTPEDFAGIKMRVMTSPLLIEAYKAYGASPTPLPYAEVYSALQLSMIDGQVNPVFAIQEMSFHEVTDYMIFPNHAQFVTTAVAGRSFFEDLPPESQSMVRETVDELHDYIFHVQRDFNTERLAIIREQRPDLTLLTLTDAEREQFRQASLPVRRQFAKRAGPQAQSLLRLLREVVAEEQAASSTRPDDAPTSEPASAQTRLPARPGDSPAGILGPASSPPRSPSDLQITPSVEILSEPARIKPCPEKTLHS